MGGEPTFVGIDEAESRQWNLDALGALKRTRGLALIRGLREKNGAGAMLHYGQGKWYPGEPLPRWALSCYWRLDGVAVWENIGWIGREEDEHGFGVNDALKFAQALTRRLEVSGENLLPAFNFGDSEEPAGYVLPLRRRQPKGDCGGRASCGFRARSGCCCRWGIRRSGIAFRWRRCRGLRRMSCNMSSMRRLMEIASSLLRLRRGGPICLQSSREPDPLPPLSSTAETCD